MPAKEIKELRQSGKLEEALIMAQEELNTQPDNIWGKRNISWVYYEYLKMYAHEFNYEGFIENLTKLKDLNLPENEVMIFDTTAWQIASGIFTLQKSESVDYSKINQVFDLIKDFHYTKPSESYSLLYKAFHKGYHNWSRYIEFADWWNFDNFRPEDYQKEEYNGRQMMSLTEQAYIAYSKALIEGEPMDAFGAQRRIDTDKIQAFLPKLDGIIESNPEYQYPPYFKAKLLLALGNEGDVLQAFLPFAKQKRNDFWVWELLAEIFEKDENLQFACYCKALSLNTPEDFLVKTRQKFAELLISKQLYVEAKTEIVKVISVRQEHGWNISSQLSTWTQSDWYINTETQANNKQLYGKHINEADEILFQDIPEKNVVVEFVNKDKRILNFIKNKSLHGYFSYKNLGIKPKIGDLLKVRLEPVGNEGFHKVLTLKKGEESNIQSCEALKEVSGSIQIPIDKNFGFLEDVFISPDILGKTPIKNGDDINCKAILSFNKKKNDWGWKCYNIIVR